MTEEALDPNKFPAFFVYDTITATPLHHPDPSSPTTTTFLPDNAGGCGAGASPAAPAQGRRKRRQRQRSCKNKEEAESQRMTHIAVERNRRRLMNDHLAVLRSLMPESYVQRGDQASVVGGAIDFVKELEQLLQSLEAQKRTLQQRQLSIDHSVHSAGGSCSNNSSSSDVEADLPPFAHFFAYPQYIWCHAPREYPPPPERRPAVADIEVTLIETHASLRILSPRRPQQLVRMVAGLQALRLSILHLSVTTLDSVVLYSLSAKVEEGCSLTTVDDIAAAVHHMLSLIEAEAAGGALSQ